jgi:hypothetical protein
MVFVIILLVLGVLALVAAVAFRKTFVFWGIPTPIVALVAAIGLLAGGLGVWKNHDDESNPRRNRARVTTEAASDNHPLVGNQGNVDPVLSTVQNWRELVQAVEGKEEWYKGCLQSRIGVTWDQARQYAGLVDQGQDLRFILVSNSSVSDERARRMLRDEGIPNVDKLQVVRVNGFENTRGLPTDRCNTWPNDPRSQVRVSLAIPKDVNDVTKGFDQSRGVLAMCSNPWKIHQVAPPATTKPKPKPAPTTTVPRKGTPPTTVPAPTTTTTRPVVTTTTTTTPPCFNCVTSTTLGRKGTPATTTPPPPTTSAPPATSPPTTTAGSPTTVQAGDGATNTSAPPTTTAPAPAPPTTSSPSTTPPPPPP